jgi:hypothetical protein
MRSMATPLALLAVVVLSLAPPTVHANTSAHVVETAPSRTAMLGQHESFWVRIAYATDAAEIAVRVVAGCHAQRVGESISIP